jgi:hypothetical protein
MSPLNKVFTRSGVLAAVFAIALAAPAAAGPQRFGGYFGGVARGHVVVRGGFYNPYWGAYRPYWGYPYAGYPYWAYPYEAYPLTPTSAVKTEVTPKQTEVYVDGYYAGVADDFDGAFKRLHTSPGGHNVTLRLDGYRTVTESIYVRPDSTYKLIDTMEKLAPGEVSAPVPLPALPTARLDSATPAPDGGSVPQR